MQPSSKFDFVEVLSPTAGPTVGFEQRLSVPIDLAERRIYLYSEIKVSGAGAYNLGLDIIAMRMGAEVGRFPADLGDFTAVTQNQSLLSLLNSGGSAVGDSLVITLAQPFTATATAVIQPLRINSEITDLVLRVRRISGSVVTGWRACLACLSSQY